MSTVSLGIRKTGFGEDVWINFISLAFQNPIRKYESAWKIVNCCINESFTLSFIAACYIIHLRGVRNKRN